MAVQLIPLCPVHLKVIQAHLIRCYQMLSLFYENLDSGISIAEEVLY